MGTRERQARERQAVARAILDAARDLFVSEGYANVSMRKIAERIEYSPAAIYRYFSSKDDLFFALAEEGFRLMAERVKPLREVADPLEAVRHLFVAFYEFSRARPEYFALMFLDRTVPRISHQYERFAFVRDTRQELIDRLHEAVDAGTLPADLQPEAAFNVLVASVHGVAVMRLCDRPPLGDGADVLVRDVIEVVLAGLRAGTRVRYARPHPEPPTVIASPAPVPLRGATGRSSRREPSSSRGSS